MGMCSYYIVRKLFLNFQKLAIHFSSLCWQRIFFTFIYLTRGFIQSDFHGIHFYVFPWIPIHDLAVANAMVYQAAELQELNLIYDSLDVIQKLIL